MEESAMHISELSEMEQFEACVELQRAVWGMDDLDILPPNLFRVYCDKHAPWGIALGAWEAGQMVGFLFCMPTSQQQALWLDMLGVLPAYQRRGLGEQLMRQLAEAAGARGIRKIIWTYDPLESVNANLYIHKLGAVCRTYEENYYRFGPSRSLSGYPADRFKVEWTIDSVGHSEQALDERDYLRVEIPGNLREMKEHSPEQALAWREKTRPHFRRINTEGYLVTGFEYDPAQQMGQYLLTRPA